MPDVIRVIGPGRLLDEGPGVVRLAEEAVGDDAGKAKPEPIADMQNASHMEN